MALVHDVSDDRLAEPRKQVRKGVQHARGRSGRLCPTDRT